MEDQEVTSVNTDDPDAVLYRAERRVLKIQTKLYQWWRRHDEYEST